MMNICETGKVTCRSEITKDKHLTDIPELDISCATYNSTVDHMCDTSFSATISSVATDMDTS